MDMTVDGSSRIKFKKNGEEGEEERQPPGWSWSNPAAQEEYQRFYESVLDKDFSLKEFGELLNPNDVPGVASSKQ